MEGIIMNNNSTDKKLLGASIGNCVHVAGVVHFLDLATNEGDSIERGNDDQGPSLCYISAGYRQI